MTLPLTRSRVTQRFQVMERVGCGDAIVAPPRYDDRFSNPLSLARGMTRGQARARLKQRRDFWTIDGCDLRDAPDGTAFVAERHGRYVASAAIIEWLPPPKPASTPTTLHLQERVSEAV